MTSPPSALSPLLLATLPKAQQGQVQQSEASPLQSYEVWGGAGVYKRLRDISHPDVALLYDSALPAKLIGEVEQILGAAHRLSLPLPAGEACKTPEAWAAALGALAQAGLKRSGAVVALGGGATTDLAGFVAACYLRGVAWYALPTTLLGMVDAALGGKTALNLPQGKNLVGAFSPPSAVYCEPAALLSLPPALYAQGLPEAVKHGLLADPELLGAVLGGELSPGQPQFLHWLGRAIAVKSEVVARDPFEAGERAHLNLGHTLAHALEAASGHAISHGQAVAYGLHYALLLSRDLGGADLSAHTRKLLHWPALELPAGPLPWEWPDLWPYMARDKKADHLGLRFVTLRALCQPALERVPESALAAAYAALQAELGREPHSPHLKGEQSP